MLIYVFKRILAAIPTLLALLAITFFIMKLIPGGPFDSERALPAEIKAEIERQYHLDEPTYKQFGRWLSGVVHGDLGPSYRAMGSRTVGEILTDAAPASLELGFFALVVAIVFGIPLGVLAAWKRGSIFDSSAMFVAVAGVSLPNYLVASILILIFSMRLGWLPPALWEDWRSAILPVAALSFRPLAMISRMTRASLLETLTSDYIRTARAKGLWFTQILFKHALKNALIPVLSLFGPLASTVIAGSFVIESVFAIPGLGQQFVSAVIDRDYTLIMGLTLFYGTLVIVVNILVDLAYGLVDPRVRVDQ